MAPTYAKSVEPIDPERFQFAFRVCDAAVAMKSPHVDPRQFGIDTGDDDGAAERSSFADEPIDRGMLAVKKEFPDPAEFASMSFRLLTFGEIVSDPELREMGLIREDEFGRTEIHPAVIVALATAPFRNSGKLDKRAYFALVKSEHQRLEAEEKRGELRISGATAVAVEATTDVPQLVAPSPTLRAWMPRAN
jgi:hypothetical protein